MESPHWEPRVGEHTSAAAERPAECLWLLFTAPGKGCSMAGRGRAVVSL